MFDRREEQEREAQEMDALLKEIEVVRHRAEERHAEKAEEVVEMDSLLDEIHQSRIGYIRELTTEKRKVDKEERLKNAKPNANAAKLNFSALLVSSADLSKAKHESCVRSKRSVSKKPSVKKKPKAGKW